MKKSLWNIVSALSDTDLFKIMLIPFWASVLGIILIFYPPTKIPEQNFFLGIFGTIVLFTISFWVVSLVDALRPRPAVLPNLPYDLFYHYKPKIVNHSGCIYLVKRLSDGVYKIGKATMMDNRVTGLRREYGPVSIIAVWEVANPGACERMALTQTRDFIFSEPGHSELRLMNEWQCWQFINDLTAYIIALDVPNEISDENQSDPNS